ncbi:unnamed protein product [Orchesella dallaii]|uniref:Uncharacterized protein n=1 Tax=Orchesella dallaii TaxID=48710 RepID=A0ABP1PZT0_9HEXA
MPDKCRQQGWFYCFSDKLCHVSKDDARDCFFKCVNIDGDLMCSAYGCVYDYTTNSCGGTFRPGKFAVNLCANSTFDSDGNWYKTDIIRRRCYPRRMPEIFPQNIKTEDYTLYRNQLEDEVMITIDVPVYEDGKYELILRISDVAFSRTSTATRYLRGFISNGIKSVTIFAGLQVNGGTGAPPPAVDQIVEITVNDNAKQMSVNGEDFEIFNYRFMVRVIRDTGTTLMHAILNAILLRKL